VKEKGESISGATFQGDIAGKKGPLVQYQKQMNAAEKRKESSVRRKNGFNFRKSSVFHPTAGKRLLDACRIRD